MLIPKIWWHLSLRTITAFHGEAGVWQATPLTTSEHPLPPLSLPLLVPHQLEVLDTTCNRLCFSGKIGHTVNNALHINKLAGRKQQQQQQQQQQQEEGMQI
jgi:hypothetical protein